MRTDRPATSAPRPPRVVPFRRSSRQRLDAAPQRKRGGPSGALPSLLRIDVRASGGVFVEGVLIEPDEVTERHRIGHVVGFGERIASQYLFEANDEDGE